MARGEDDNQTPGPAVDRQGRPVIDPTANVLQLVEAAIARQDDLRTLEAAHRKDHESMRGTYLAAERQHLRELAEIRATYDDKLRDAEAKRIDAIRAVDVQAVSAAAQVQATQATTLAAQVATSAETLRNQVAAAATAQTVALAAALEPVQKDIADLRRAQYEAQGQKTQVVESQASTSTLTAVVAAVIATLVLALGIFAATRTSEPAPPPTVVTVTDPG